MSEWMRPESLPFPSIWVEFRGKKEYNGQTRQYWIQDITDDYIDDVITYMTTQFTREEPLTKYSGICDDLDASEEFGDILRLHLSQKIGLVCLTCNDLGVPEIAGINCTAIIIDNENPDSIRTERIRRLHEATSYIIDSEDFSKTLGVDHYVTALGLFVPLRFRGEGIGEALLRAREPLCRAIGEKVTATLFTSTTSQILAERAGLVRMSYADFVEAGENFIFPGIQEAVKEIRFMYMLYE